MSKKQAEKRFIEFSSYLVVRALNICVVPFEVEDEVSKIWCFQYESLEYSINSFRCIFNQEFKELFHLELKFILEQQVSRIKFILSRCLAMCDEPSYKNFVFVCAFIFHMIFCWFTERHCYQIIIECQFCLYALYKRKFWKIFQTPEDYTELKSVCNELNEIISPKLEEEELNDALDALPDRGQSAFELIEKCIRGTEDFSFTPLEITFCEREKARVSNNFEKQFEKGMKNTVSSTVYCSDCYTDSEISLDDVTVNQMDTNNNIMEFETDICEFCGFNCGL